MWSSNFLFYRSIYKGVYKLDIEQDVPPTGVRRIYLSTNSKPDDTATICNAFDFSDKQRHY